MVSMKILKHSNLQQGYAHSMVISLLRGLAAIEVAAAHLRAHAFPGYSTVAEPTLWFQALAFVTGFAHQAVVVFFVLSGWLVGGSLLNKAGQERAIKHYAIDRLTRLWIVLIPTFVLILAAALIMGKLDPQVGQLRLRAMNIRLPPSWATWSDCRHCWFPCSAAISPCGVWPTRHGITCCSRCWS